jgi:LysM repeat protein
MRKIAFIFSTALLLVVSSLQAQEEKFILFDPNCMHFLDYELSKEVKEQGYWEFVLKTEEGKFFVFTVIKQAVYLDETTELSEGFITCDNKTEVDENFLQNVNNGSLIVKWAVYDKTKKVYRVYTAKKGYQIKDTNKQIHFRSEQLFFDFKKNLSDQGLNLDSTGGRVLYQSLLKFKCYSIFQFRAFDRKQPRIIRDIYYLEGLGISKITGEEGTITLVRVNEIPLDEFLKEYCKSKDVFTEKDSMPQLGTLSSGQPSDSSQVKKDMHQVVEGDNLYQIAKKYNTTVDVLMKINQLENAALKKGQWLKIKATEISTDDNPSWKKDEKNGYNIKIHKVKQGETLMMIAKKYGINISVLQELNSLADSKIDINQQLIIEISK